MEDETKRITCDELRGWLSHENVTVGICSLSRLEGNYLCDSSTMCGDCLTKSLLVIAESWEADVSELQEKLAGVERTCEMDDYKTGEKAEYNECEEHIYHCESCHEERGVYAYNENGDVWAEMPMFCPACGAKVVER